MFFTRASIMIASLAIAAPAMATVTTIDFTADSAPTSFFPVPFVDVETYQLTNTATNDSTIAPFTLSIGDHISGTITFGSPVTVPAAPFQNGFSFLILPDSNLSTLGAFGYSVTAHVFDGLTEISSPAVQQYLGFGIGFTADSAFGSPAPALTFDRITYDLSFSDLNDTSYQYTPSGTLAGSAGFESYSVSPMSAPEPTTWMTMILGFGAIGFALRRRLACSFFPG